MAVLALLAGCAKTPVPEPDPDDPGTPELPKPPYDVEQTDFATYRDGLKIGGYVYTPRDLPGKKPAVILCTGLDGTWADTEPYAKAATTMGLVSCCFDFCGGPAGASLSDGDKANNSVLTEIEDLGAVYNAIAERADVDPGKIFLMGGSQGGLVSAENNHGIITANGHSFAQAEKKTDNCNFAILSSIRFGFHAAKE